MFDAEQEDREDEAVRVIQRKCRVFIARLRLIKLTRSNYLKKYDRINDYFYYKNKTTGAILRDKPVCLGMDDLPDPREFDAPEGYDAMDEENAASGFAIVLVNNEFPSSHGKFPNLPASTVSEFLALEDVLTNDFICKFPAENTYFMRNAKCFEFKDMLDRLKSTIKKKNFLVLYICTHVITVVGGEKQNPHETAYLCMNDSIFTKPEDIVKTCVSLTELSILMNKLACKKKTVIMNYAHVPPPEKSFFAPVKVMYPPKDFLSRMANMMDCAVLASCISGCSMSDALKQGPHRMKIGAATEAEKEAEEKEKEEEMKKKEKKDKKAKKAEHDTEEKDAAGGAGNEDEVGEHADANADRPTSKDDHHHQHRPGSNENFGARPGTSKEVVEEEELSDNEDDRDYENEDFQTAIGGGFNHHAHLHHQNKVVVFRSDPTQRIVDEYLEYWKVPPDPSIVITERPNRPVATWKRDEETNNEFDITLPTDKETRDHRVGLLLWRLKRIVRPPVNFFKVKYREFLRRHLYAPEQCSIYLPGDELSVFGTALIKGLEGEAHKPNKKQVSIKMLYECIKENVPKRLRQYKEDCNKQFDLRLSNAQLIMALGDEEAPGWMSDDAFKEFKIEVEDERREINNMKAQSPTLFIPTKNVKAGKNPVCYRCGPASAPERPYIVRTGVSEIALEWYDQPFDGVETVKYSVEVKNHTRVFHTWQVVPSPRDIVSTTYIVRDLPSGVPCQFRCRAFNPGGWSQYSAATQMVTPGDSLTPMPTQARWRRVVQGGILATMDLIMNRPVNRTEHIIGLQKIIAFVMVDCGFKKSAVQIKAANVAMHDLMTFTHDAEIATPAFTILGWCMKEGSPGLKRVKIYLRKMKPDAIAIEFMENGRFRLDTNVMSAILFFRSQSMIHFPEGTPGHVPALPEIDIPEDNNVDINDDEEEEQKAIAEDSRKVAEAIQAAQDEKDFLERTAATKAAEKARLEADEMARKKAEKWERDREREKEANKYK